MAQVKDEYRIGEFIIYEIPWNEGDTKELSECMKLIVSPKLPNTPSQTKTKLAELTSEIHSLDRKSKKIEESSKLTLEKIKDILRNPVNEKEESKVGKLTAKELVVVSDDEPLRKAKSYMQRRKANPIEILEIIQID